MGLGLCEKCFNGGFVGYASGFDKAIWTLVRREARVGLIQLVGREITNSYPGTSCQDELGCHQAHTGGAAKELQRLCSAWMPLCRVC